MNFNETDEFKKDFKRLSRKYVSLSDDILEFKKIASKFPFGNSKHFTPLHIQENITVIKARLFCRYLKGTSLRVIYAYNSNKQLIEFIEMYFKGDKETEDRARILNYCRRN
jgi:mRNA-degrading endonuclease RelE of RelBE toxin-antitoxin system